MAESSCRQKAKAKGVSFVWGNGGYCHHYKVLLDRTKTATAGKGHWKTCGDYKKPSSSNGFQQAGKQATGDSIICVVSEFDFYYAHMEARCNKGFEVNRFTGKCVSKANPHIDPASCDNACGYGFCCSKQSGICLECGSESEPATKACSAVYGCTGSSCLWWNVGETADEEALGLTFDSDELAESVAITESISSASGFDVAVGAFAVLGFAVTVYGAYQHYSK